MRNSKNEDFEGRAEGSGSGDQDESKTTKTGLGPSKEDSTSSKRGSQRGASDVGNTDIGNPAHARGMGCLADIFEKRTDGTRVNSRGGDAGRTLELAESESHAIDGSGIPRDRARRLRQYARLPMAMRKWWEPR